MAQARRKTNAKRKSGKRAPARSGSPLWLWGMALVAVAGGIALYDNAPAARRLLADLGLTGSKPERVASRLERSAEGAPPAHKQGNASRPATGPSSVPVPPRPVGVIDRSETAAIRPPAPIGRSAADDAAQRVPQAAASRERGEALRGAYEAKFFLCGTARQDDCVLSADRFVFHGRKIRLAGVEVPDIHKPRCEAERIKASDAKLRARAFLDSGPFELVTLQGKDAEVNGHTIGDVTRNGRSLTEVLVGEGLAKRPGAGGKTGWCS